ncbi:MAG: hypothetical protein C0434_03450 [Xanthomonadaceae bacterium]|nr:hypothetical protein [Xanthomonadaceae bacterium]
MTAVLPAGAGDGRSAARLRLRSGERLFPHPADAAFGPLACFFELSAAGWLAEPLPPPTQSGVPT